MAKIVSIEYIRAFAIILVVIGHFAPDYSPEWWKQLHSLIYSFHMPLFLIISGFVYAISKHKSYADLLVRRSKRLLLPYFSASIIIICLKFLTDSYLSVENPVDETAFFKMFLLPEAGYFLWYIFVLFESVALVGLCRQNKICHRWLLLLAAVLYYLPIELTDYLCLNEFKRFFVFFMVGVIVADFDIKKYFNNYVWIASGIIWLGLFMLEPKNSLLFPVMAISGSIFISGICRKVVQHNNSIKWLILISSASYFIYLFHTTFEGLAKALVAKLIDNSQDYFVPIAIVTIFAGVVIPLLIYKFVEKDKICRFLFGISKKKVTVVLLIITLMVSCNTSNEKPVENVIEQVENTDSIEIFEDEYLVDNDIAMTVKSIADAISVGEELDTAEYNFEGILTDGEGTPLYTDAFGYPGEWAVDVIGPNAVRIRNIHLGNLTTENLAGYITESLELINENNTNNADSIDNSDVLVYDFDGGTIRFKTYDAVTYSGEEGPIVSILVTGDTIVCEPDTLLLLEDEPTGGFKSGQSH